MKKSLLVLVFLALFTYTTTAQDKEANVENKSELFDSKGLMSQLKEQLKSQLRDQFVSQIRTQFESMSNRELNHAIDSMLIQVDEVIEKTRNFSKDSLDLIYEFLPDLKLNLNDEDMDGTKILEKEELMDFYDSMKSQSLKMRKELKSIRKIKNRDKKAERLSDSMVSFINESGILKLMEKMIDKMMPQ